MKTARTARNSLAALFLVGSPPLLQAHVDLDAPNGGELLDVQRVVTIQWTVVVQHNTANWDLWYSTTGPSGPWIDIAIDLPPGDTSGGAVHTYDWTVPDELSDRVRVRVRQDNDNDQDYEDVSDGDLTIRPLVLEARPTTVRVGDRVTLETRAATVPRARAGLFVVDVDGTPGVLPIAFRALDSAGKWTLDATVPPVASGLSVTLLSYAVQGDIWESNAQTVTIL